MELYNERNKTIIVVALILTFCIIVLGFSFSIDNIKKEIEKINNENFECKLNNETGNINISFINFLNAPYSKYSIEIKCQNS